jgi:hypothetical protein
MNSRHTTQLRTWALQVASVVASVIFNGAALGQPANAPRAALPLMAAASAPAITILSSTTGASLLSLGAGNASLNLGPVSYFKGTSVRGEAIQKAPGAFVITTRFILRVDCPRTSPSSQVVVTMSRLDASASHVIAVDGTPLGSTPQTLEPSMPCGSSGEHRLDVEVPVSTPAGSIASNVAFLATFKK